MDESVLFAGLLIFLYSSRTSRAENRITVFTHAYDLKNGAVFTSYLSI